MCMQNKSNSCHCSPQESNFVLLENDLITKNFISWLFLAFKYNCSSLRPDLQCYARGILVMSSACWLVGLKNKTKKKTVLSLTYSCPPSFSTLVLIIPTLDQWAARKRATSQTIQPIGVLEDQCVQKAWRRLLWSCNWPKGPTRLAHTAVV